MDRKPREGETVMYAGGSVYLESHRGLRVGDIFKVYCSGSYICIDTDAHSIWYLEEWVYYTEFDLVPVNERMML